MLLLVRGQNVTLDRDQVELYEVETRSLSQAVKRNVGRFPSGFMFQLDREQIEDWRSRFVMSNPSVKMRLRLRPYDDLILAAWGRRHE